MILDFKLLLGGVKSELLQQNFIKDDGILVKIINLSCLYEFNDYSWFFYVGGFDGIDSVPKKLQSCS